MKRQTLPMENPGCTVITEKPEVCCCIGPDWNDPVELIEETTNVIKEDLRHFGRCQKVKFYFLPGFNNFPGKTVQMKTHLEDRTPMILEDLTHAPLVRELDVTKFDGRPGSVIRISPKERVTFVNVTVKIDDFSGREIVHEHAWLENDQEHWSFVFFPKQKFSDTTGRLKVEIKASQERRKPRQPFYDPYELSPDDLTRVMAMTN